MAVFCSSSLRSWLWEQSSPPPHCGLRQECLKASSKVLCLSMIWPPNSVTGREKSKTTTSGVFKKIIVFFTKSGRKVFSEAIVAYPSSSRPGEGDPLEVWRTLSQGHIISSENTDNCVMIYNRSKIIFILLLLTMKIILWLGATTTWETS